MTTVQIAYEVSSKKFQEIKDFLSTVDVNWNGDTFNLERDDFTCIKDDNSANAVSLLIEIQSIINS